MDYLSQEHNRHIIILGAGISGLWAAYSFLKANSQLNITVLEKQDHPGGLFDSSDRCGFHFNHGLFLFPKDSPLIELMPHRFLPVVVSYDKFLSDRLIRFPVDPSEMTALMKPKNALHFLIHQIKRFSKKSMGYVPANLEEWLHLNMPENWSTHFRIEDYIFKLMGHEASKLSQDVGIQRLEYIIRMQRSHNLIRHLIRRLHMMTHPKPPITPMSQVSHQTLNSEGTGGFIKELAKQVQSMGARIDTRVKIQQIQSNNGGYQILTQDRDPLNCDIVVSTIPVTELIPFRTDESIPTDRLKWQTLSLYFFRLKRSIPAQPIRVIYSFDRSQCWKRTVMRRIDDTYCAVRAEITTSGPTTDQRDKLMLQIRSDLSGILDVRNPEDWVEWDAIDVPYGYPCLLSGYESDFARLSPKTLGPGLYSLSRQGSHRYATSSTCARLIQADVANIMARHPLS